MISNEIEMGDEFITQISSGAIKVAMTEESSLFKVSFKDHSGIEVEYLNPEAHSSKQAVGDAISAKELQEISLAIKDHYL